MFGPFFEVRAFRLQWGRQSASQLLIYSIRQLVNQSVT